MKKEKDKQKTIKNKINHLVNKSKNEKVISTLDIELKDLVAIIKPTNTSKIYEKFE